jgi:hypothetical protein
MDPEADESILGILGYEKIWKHPNKPKWLLATVWTYSEISSPVGMGMTVSDLPEDLIDLSSSQAGKAGSRRYADPTLTESAFD